MIHEVVKKYTNALIEIAFLNKKEDLFIEQLRAFRGALRSNAAILDFFVNPAVSKKDKKEVFLLPDIDIQIQGFIQVIIDNRREDSFLSIIEEFITEINRRRHIERAMIYVADKSVISQALQSKIKTNLLKLTGDKEISIDVLEDKNLIAGARIFVGNKEIDFSFKSQLQEIKRELRNFDSA